MFHLRQYTSNFPTLIYKKPSTFCPKTESVATESNWNSRPNSGPNYNLYSRLWYYGHFLCHSIIFYDQVEQNDRQIKVGNYILVTTLRVFPWIILFEKFRVFSRLAPFNWMTFWIGLRWDWTFNIFEDEML